MIQVGIQDQKVPNNFIFRQQTIDNQVENGLILNVSTNGNSFWSLGNDFFLS